ncbi:MAG: hypothetical protein ACP5SD_06270 [Elusimicrobiales bacterium]|jgi:hypothetical protein|nr:hypothetical protein [Elusimicrobiales bacterium]HOL62919.1 hypothetical protein [Elusimicrobiales bacterium]HPO96266.1 hypothetical protein [Elusimicrobiales bacterium]
MASYKLCGDCGYKNRLNSDLCGVCGSRKLVLIEENRKSNIKYFFVFFVLFFIVLYIFYNKKEKAELKTEEIPVFVSEKRPINYYTYMRSLKKMSGINPDENDEKAIRRALNYEDKTIKETALFVLKKWSQNPGIKEEKRKEYLSLINTSSDKK